MSSTMFWSRRSSRQRLGTGSLPDSQRSSVTGPCTHQIHRLETVLASKDNAGRHGSSRNQSGNNPESIGRYYIEYNHPTRVLRRDKGETLHSIHIRTESRTLAEKPGCSRDQTRSPASFGRAHSPYERSTSCRFSWRSFDRRGSHSRSGSSARSSCA